MTGFAATHTGSLTPSSDPWTFVGTVTWQSDIDPAILPDNEPVVLRLAFTTLSLTGATIAFRSSGSGSCELLRAGRIVFLAAGLAVAAGPVERSATYRSAVAFDVVGDAVCGVSGAPSADWAAAVAVGRDGGVASRRHTPRLMEAVR